VHKGFLLTAIGIDAENHYFLLAYAIVHINNKENWSYFFNGLRGIIGDDSSGQYTFIVDRYKVTHCYILWISTTYFMFVSFFCFLLLLKCNSFLFFGLMYYFFIISTES